MCSCWPLTYLIRNVQVCVWRVRVPNFACPAPLVYYLPLPLHRIFSWLICYLISRRNLTLINRSRIFPRIYYYSWYEEPEISRLNVGPDSQVGVTSGMIFVPGTEKMVSCFRPKWTRACTHTHTRDSNLSSPFFYEEVRLEFWFYPILGPGRWA